VIILEIYRRLPSPSARTHSCWCGRSARLRYSRGSWDRGLRVRIGWRSGWPTRRTWGTTGPTGLRRGRSTVEAYAAAIVDVGVEHLGDEFYLRWFARVFLGEFEGEFEQSALPSGALGALDEGGPLEEVALYRVCADAIFFLVAHPLQVADETLFGWG
jgi:hypothetical protein